MDDPKNVLDFLHQQFARVNVKLDDLRMDMVEVKERIGFLEAGYASLSRRVDQINARLDRIEPRLDLVDAPLP